MNEILQQVLAELPEVRLRAEKATPGPWFYEDNELSWDLYTNGHAMFNPKLIKAPKKSSEYAEYWPDQADANFIVHAREDVPKLCNAVQAAAREIERLSERNPYLEELANTAYVENQRLQAEIERKDQLLDTIESYAGGGSREQEGIGLSAAHIAEMVRKAREGGKRG